jgi:hypothetical protein
MKFSDENNLPSYIAVQDLYNLIDRKSDEQAFLALAQERGWAQQWMPAATLNAIPVPNPSDAVAAEMGTASVAEAAALIAAGPGARAPVLAGQRPAVRAPAAGGAAAHRVHGDDGRARLLDFGAARVVPDHISDGYRALLASGLVGDDAALLDAMAGIGILPPNAPAAMSETIVAMARDGFAPLRLDGPFDFGTGGLAGNLKDQSQSLIGQREHFIAPPPDILFIQRKIAGMYLLAARLKARVDVAALVRPYTGGGSTQASTQPRATRAATHGSFRFWI